MKKNSANSALQKQINHLRHQISGVKIRVKPDAPSTVPKPWNSVTIVTTPSVSSDFLVSNLKSLIITQLQLSGNNGSAWEVPIEFRIKKIRGYAAASSLGSVLLTMTLYDFGLPDNNVLTLIKDQGTATNPATIGYIYPERVSNNPLGTTEHTRKIFTPVSTSNDFKVYFDVLWRSL